MARAYDGTVEFARFVQLKHPAKSVIFPGSMVKTPVSGTGDGVIGSVGFANGSAVRRLRKRPAAARKMFFDVGDQVTLTRGETRGFGTTLLGLLLGLSSRSQRAPADTDTFGRMYHWSCAKTASSFWLRSTASS